MAADGVPVRGNSTPWLITSLPFARQDDLVATLASVRWTLVIARWPSLSRQSVSVMGIHPGTTG